MSHPGTAKLQRYVLGELSSAGRLAVDRHLTDCPRCRALVEEERRLDELVVGSLGATAAAGDADAAFARLWAEVDAESTVGEPSAEPFEESEENRSDAPGVVLELLVDDEGPGSQGSSDDPIPTAASRWPWVAAAAAVLLGVVWWSTGGASGPWSDGPGQVADAPHETPRVGDAEAWAPETGPAVATEGRTLAPTPEPPWPLDAPWQVADPIDVLVAKGGAPADGLPGTAAPWEPVDAARLELARMTVGQVLRTADEQFPFAKEAFRLACDQGLAELRMQGWPVAALVRGLALGSDDLTAGAALRHAALDRSNYLVLARALGSEERVDDALAVLEMGAVEVGVSSSLVKALERLAGAHDGTGTATESPDMVQRRRAALAVLLSATEPRVRHAWERLADRTVSDLSRSRHADDAVARMDELAARWPADVAVAVLEEVAAAGTLHEAGRVAFLAHVDRLGAVAVQRLDEVLARRPQPPVLLSWCVEAQLEEVIPVLVRALEDGAVPAELLPSLTALGGIGSVEGLHSLWRESHSPQQAERFLVALTGLFTADDTLARRYGGTRRVDSAEQLAKLAEALPEDARHGLLLGALESGTGRADLGAHRAALLVALGRTGSRIDGRDLVRWIDELPAHDAIAPLAWAAAGRLAPEAAALVWRERVGDPRLLTEVVEVTSPRLAVDLEPSARTLAPLTAALDRAASRTPPETDSLPIPDNPPMEVLP